MTSHPPLPGCLPILPKFVPLRKKKFKRTTEHQILREKKRLIKQEEASAHKADYKERRWVPHFFYVHTEALHIQVLNLAGKEMMFLL